MTRLFGWDRIKTRFKLYLPGSYVILCFIYSIDFGFNTAVINRSKSL